MPVVDYKKIGEVIGRSQAEIYARTDVEIQKLREENHKTIEETKELIFSKIEQIDAETVDVINEIVERHDMAHALELEELTKQLKAQEIFEAQLTTRLAEIKDGEKGEQGFPGEPGRDGLDRPLLEPVELLPNKDYSKNTLGIHNGGLWISTKQAVGDPESDPHAWSCILDSMTTMSIDLQDDRTFKLSVRMATGKLIEDTFKIPYPEHKGIWEPGTYLKGDMVTKGTSFWMAMEDTDGEPPGNGWQQILSAPRGKTGPAGKSIVGPQGKPGRNGADAKLPPNFVEDLVALASERKAFEDGRSGAYAITSFRGNFSPGESYSSGDVVAFDGGMYLCTSPVNRVNSIAASQESWELILGVPKVAFVPYMHWQGVYTEKAYNPGMVVTDGGWTMVANKKTTDKAAPAAIGDPEWTLDSTDANWAIQNVLGTNVRCGNYAIADHAVLVKGIRIYVPQVDANIYYRAAVAIYRDPANPDIEYTDWVNYQQTGWVETTAFGRIIPKDVGLAVAIETENRANNVVDEVLYNYTSSTGDVVPGPGAMHRRTNRTYVWINKLGELGQPTIPPVAGSQLTTSVSDWNITQVTDAGEYWDCEIVGTGNPANGLTFFTFTTPSGATPQYWAENTGYWTTNPPAEGVQVNGFIRNDGVLSENDNAYGADILLQEMYLSNDWDIVSYSGDLATPSSFTELSPNVTNWANEVATPFAVGNAQSVNNSWVEVFRTDMDSRALKASLSVDAKRNDDVEYHVSEWVLLSYDKPTGVVDYLQKDLEIGADLSLRSKIDGKDLVLEVKGKPNQTWDFRVTTFYRELN